MATKVFNQLEPYEWIGSFSYPDNSYEFAGKLKYSPEHGVQLDYLTGFQPTIPETTHLHGVLKDDQPCTLIGNFNPQGGGMTFGDVASTYQGTRGFACVVFGTHTSPTELYKGIRVNFSSFQEFCYPQGTKDDAPFIMEPEEKYSGEELEVSVVNEGSFRYVFNLVNQLYITDDNLKKEVEKFFDGLEEKFPESPIMLRKDIKWFLEIIEKNEVVIEDLIKTAWSFNRLFALLMFHPTKPIELKLVQEDDDGKRQYYNMLVHVSGLSTRALQVLRYEPFHHNLAITPKKIQFVKSIEKWIDAEGGYDLFALKLSNDYGQYYEYELHAELVLALTQLEKIAYDAGKKGNEKYTYPIQRYDRWKLTQTIRYILGLNDSSEENIGVVLSDIRAEVAHVGRPRKYLEKLPTAKVMWLCRCLDILIATHIYEALEIPLEAIGEFQRKNLTHISMQLSEQGS